MPLVQSVVATGQVITVSRAQVGSEVTGVVLERRVKESDRVKPGDLLVVLKSDELAAQVRQAEVALNELTTNRRPQASAELASAKAQLEEQASREATRRRNAEAGILSAEEIEQAVEAERVARNNYETVRLKAAALAPGQVEEASLREQLSVAQAQLAKTKIRATVAGTVLTRDVEPGDLVQDVPYLPLQWMVIPKSVYHWMNVICHGWRCPRKLLQLPMPIRINLSQPGLTLLHRVSIPNAAQ